MIALSKILVEPAYPKHLPRGAKWLAGEGAGSWFIIENMHIDGIYKISRYSTKGDFECSSQFSLDDIIDLSEEYAITYPSHCSIVSIFQKQKTHRFKSLQ